MRDSNPRNLAPESEVSYFSCVSEVQYDAHSILHPLHVGYGNGANEINESGFGDASQLKGIGRRGFIQIVRRVWFQSNQPRRTGKFFFPTRNRDYDA
jgi:hypothetical protein